MVILIRVEMGVGMAVRKVGRNRGSMVVGWWGLRVRRIIRVWGNWKKGRWCQGHYKF